MLMKPRDRVFEDPPHSQWSLIPLLPLEGTGHCHWFPGIVWPLGAVRADPHDAVRSIAYSLAITVSYRP